MFDRHIQVSVVEPSAQAWLPDGPLYGDASDHARAFEAGLASVTHSVGLVSIVRALLDSPTTVEHWPSEAWRMLNDAVDEHVQRWVDSHRGSLEAVPEVVDAVVWTVRRVLAPARNVPSHYAPVAVLLGPRLRELRYTPGASLRAVWAGGETTVRPDLSWFALAHALVPRWSAPAEGMRSTVEANGFDADALRLGELVAWHELSDRSVLDIAAFESWRLHDVCAASPGSIKAFLAPELTKVCRRDLGFALAEAAYRDLLPTADALRVAADLAEAQGVLTADAIGRWTLVELWARCTPLLWERNDRRRYTSLRK